ncbi:uncharacterized protein LOC124170973 [Ischnura elegans]|uniref:uncharacterized protein LOC124170973 n=1 Tax=Ischnura elegans TaxID=197161 RepID=UPI001ED874AA|nr:uncharacterized protein LOC124170973 [Ischnura elegans]XP_046406021.1 uncharacterized protein LOC124170973 [Ischnura elegans]
MYVAKRICERHFAEECFVVGIKKNALPSRELPELTTRKLPSTAASPSHPTTPEGNVSAEAEPPQAPVKRRASARGQGMKGVLHRVGTRKAVELTSKAKHLYETAKHLQRSVQHSSKKLFSFKKRLQASEKTLNICPGFFEGLPQIVSVSAVSN